MKKLAEEIQIKIDVELQKLNLDIGSAMDNAMYMVKFIAPLYEQLRKAIVDYNFPDTENEIHFFKNLKPNILGKYMYFSKVYNIEVKCPDGSNEKILEYLNTELDKLTFFFRNNADFYQYFRSKSTHLDTFYFIRKEKGIANLLNFESFQFDIDPQFSTGYDYKAAKIQCNKMLKCYLDKKIANINNINHIDKIVAQHNVIRFTGKKVALIELCYALASSGDINHGNIEIKEIMDFFSVAFNIDLGGYYDAYIAMKERKDRTSYLNKLIDSLTKRMNEDDMR